MRLFRRPPPPDADAPRADPVHRAAATVQLIPRAGACLVSRNVLSGAGRVRWMVREPSRAAADNGWRIFSSIDSTEYLHDARNLAVAEFNAVCELEPALIGIWDLPVGADLQLVDEGDGLHVVHTATGVRLRREELYVPE